ncbi:MAG: cobalamin biosynthesis protein CbiX [Verrucomicrobiae bacterium]|nr:cobalamin biosynthesis protein CbiX [Verrucomicrobiae bacterium]
MHHFKDTTLIIVGHGSTENPDSSEPTHEHADTIRQREIFEEVRSAFWKEEPSLREVLYGIKSNTVIVVPNFISEGYFTQKVIPRELELNGSITHRGSQKIFYADPVGIHPLMTQALLQRAQETAPNVPPDQTTLFIVGHGTGLNENSAKAAKDQVALIQKMNRYAEVLPSYMEEAPLISDWDRLSSQQHVVVVPFFISDGLHSYQDIPVLLGIEKEIGPAASQAEVFRRNPYHLRGKTLYYASSIGTEPMMAEVILDQAASCFATGV